MMKRLTSGVLALVTTVAVTGALAQEGAKKKRGTFQAQRAGWMAGMYVGEEKGNPYPFVLQLNEESDARKKGIRTGDELIRVQDEEVRSLPYVFEKVNKMRPGRELALWVRRGSQTLQFKIRIPKPVDPAEAAKSEEKKAKAGEEGAASEGEEGAKKKKKKKLPVVIKPIPADE